MIEMYYTPKAVFDLLLALKQQAAYELVIWNPPFAASTKLEKAA